jgi:hypothetical protein
MFRIGHGAVIRIVAMQPYEQVIGVLIDRLEFFVGLCFAGAEAVEGFAPADTPCDDLAESLGVADFVFVDKTFRCPLVAAVKRPKDQQPCFGGFAGLFRHMIGPGAELW